MPTGQMIEWTPEEDQRILELRARVPPVTWDKMPTHFPGRSTSAIEARHRRLKKEIARGETEVEANNPEEMSQKLVSNEPLTLEVFLSRLEVDLEQWVVKDWKAAYWNMGAKHPVTGQILIAPLYGLQVWFRRKSVEVITAQEIAKANLADLKAMKPMHQPIPYVLSGTDRYCFEYSPFDLHMGKYTWGEETVTNYDVDLAEELFNKSLDYLVSKALRNAGHGSIEEILFPVGNDASHVDGKKMQTTGGTPMEAFDSRYVKVFRKLCQVHRRAVMVLREIAPVKIIVVPGNHDEETAWHLGDHLEAWFHTDPHVKVHNTARLRKYHEYGVTLLGFTHGVYERPAELPLMMAREEPERWARCQQREWHIGHKHKADAMKWRELDSDKGVRVRILSSMSAHDFWHTNNGYMDRRACDAFLWHRQAGFTDHMSFNVDHFTGEPMV